MIAALAGGTYCWPMACRVKAIAVEKTPVYRISIQPAAMPPSVGCSKSEGAERARARAVAKKLTAEMVTGRPVSCTSWPSTATCTAQDTAQTSSRHIAGGEAGEVGAGQQIDAEQRQRRAEIDDRMRPGARAVTKVTSGVKIT